MIARGVRLKTVARRDWHKCGEPQSEMVMVAKIKVTSEAPRPRAQDLDRHIGERMRQRRIMLGLTQQQMADLIGVTYQQAHKYEKGINRIASGRLYRIAQALGVEVGYFYEAIADVGVTEHKSSPQQRLLLELARNFVVLTNRKHQEAICNLARALAATAVTDGEFAGSSPRMAANAA